MIRKILCMVRQVINHFITSYENLENPEWNKGWFWTTLGKYPKVVDKIVDEFQRIFYPIAMEVDRKYSLDLTGAIDSHGYMTEEHDTYVLSMIHGLWDCFEFRMTRDAAQTVYNENGCICEWDISQHIADQHLDTAEKEYCEWLDHVKYFEASLRSRNWLQKLLHVPDIYQELVTACNNGITHCQSIRDDWKNARLLEFTPQNQPQIVTGTVADLNR